MFIVGLVDMQGRIKLVGIPMPNTVGSQAPYNTLIFDQIIMNCSLNNVFMYILLSCTINSEKHVAQVHNRRIA